MNAHNRIGIDVGSKTIKIVVLDEAGDVVHGIYYRHGSDVLTTLADTLHMLVWRHGDIEGTVAMTGSAGIALSEALGIPFVQEVVATTCRVRERHPDADCIIELGGEDAKVVYLTGGLEQRMNATCAGGTGDFIDTIAHMLGVKTKDLSALALGAKKTYPIASRCAVFAQTDVRPLLNSGAAKADIAASALDAVVRQTLGGLACGRPIRGKVVFLGGPLEHIPALVIKFRQALGIAKGDGVKPDDAHVYTAAGAILAAENAPQVSLAELEQRVRNLPALDDDVTHLPPLFRDREEFEAFREWHADARMPRKLHSDFSGDLYVGMDAGSTATKAVIIDSDGNVVASDYRSVGGDVLSTARDMLVNLLARACKDADGKRVPRRIAHATVTGYGESLLIAGLGFDSGVVETAAHVKAACELVPDATFVLDIGGQDMKALWLRDGGMVDAVLNEACSSGCGAFVESSARALRMSTDDFVGEALYAASPVNLGAKCTVFMTSRVRHAQKIGATKGDIAAGVAYSVVNNVFTRIIGRARMHDLGNRIVVQGGTFRSDAILRAFEQIVGVEAVRPDEAHLMGAYGAALIARDRGREASSTQSALLSIEDLQRLAPSAQSLRCPGCSNSCLLSIIDFGDSRHHVSGNRCSRAEEVIFAEEAGTTATEEEPPDVAALEQRLLSACGDVRGPSPRGEQAIGLPCTFDAYEHTPFWHAFFRHLGFSVIVADDVKAGDYQGKAYETIPSESVCYPAKLLHLRYAYLVSAGAQAVFVPTIADESLCPVASGYARALIDNVGGNHVFSPLLSSPDPEVLASSEDDRRCLLSSLSALCDAITAPELDRAISAGLAAQRAFRDEMEAATAHAFSWLGQHAGRRGVILAARPYHVDPSLLHDINRELQKLGFAVIPTLGLGRAARNSNAAQALWRPEDNYIGLVQKAAADRRLDVVALRSFACMYDAVSCDEARDAANQLGIAFTELKIDDIVDTAHIRIRLRTLAQSPHKQQEEHSPARIGTITPDLCSTAIELTRRLCAQVNSPEQPEQVTTPATCRHCLDLALAFELYHSTGKQPPIKVDSRFWRQPAATAGNRSRPTIGILGNPLLVFDETMNEGLMRLLSKLSCNVALPEPANLLVDDVRYLDQLDAFARAGVNHVLYLQSFGCLKGHVQSRGSLHELARLHPDIPITVIDYDPESSALNRENRIRLAVESARLTVLEPAKQNPDPPARQPA